MLGIWKVCQTLLICFEMELPMLVVYDSLDLDEVLITTSEKEDEMVKIWFPERPEGRDREKFDRRVYDDAVEIFIRGIEVNGRTITGWKQ